MVANGIVSSRCYKHIIQKLLLCFVVVFLLSPRIVVAHDVVIPVAVTFKHNVQNSLVFVWRCLFTITFRNMLAREANEGSAERKSSEGHH